MLHYQINRALLYTEKNGFPLNDLSLYGGRKECKRISSNFQVSTSQESSQMRKIKTVSKKW